MYPLCYIDNDGEWANGLQVRLEVTPEVKLEIRPLGLEQQ